MIIKPNPSIPIESIQNRLRPLFVLIKTSEGVYELEVNGTTLKECPMCLVEHTYVLSTCKACSKKLNKELLSPDVGEEGN